MRVANIKWNKTRVEEPNMVVYNGKVIFDIGKHDFKSAIKLILQFFTIISTVLKRWNLLNLFKSRETLL